MSKNLWNQQQFVKMFLKISFLNFRGRPSEFFTFYQNDLLCQSYDLKSLNSDFVTYDILKN